MVEKYEVLFIHLNGAALPQLILSFDIQYKLISSEVNKW